MRSPSALTICGLYLLLIVLSGCETVKGLAKGSADGFYKDYVNTKKNIEELYGNTEEGIGKTDDWIRENLW